MSDSFLTSMQKLSFSNNQRGNVKVAGQFKPKTPTKNKTMKKKQSVFNISKFASDSDDNMVQRKRKNRKQGRQTVSKIEQKTNDAMIQDNHSKDKYHRELIRLILTATCGDEVNIDDPSLQEAATGIVTSVCNTNQEIYDLLQNEQDLTTATVFTRLTGFAEFGTISSKISSIASDFEFHSDEDEQYDMDTLKFNNKPAEAKRQD